MSVNTPSSTYPVVDRAFAAIFLVLTQIEVWVFTLGDGYGIGTRVGAAILTALASVALAWRRSRPVAAYWANAVGVVGTIVIGFPGDIYQYTNLIALYSIGAHGSRTARWLALPAGVAGVLLYFVRFPDEGNLTLAAFIATLWVAGWLLGLIYGARLEEVRLRREMDLSRQLAEANEQRLVLEEERVRIARELHDIIGHTVNVIVVHAGAGRLEIGGDPSLVRQAFDTIESTGRVALGELDRVLALLRGDEAEADLLPTPGLDDLETLAATFVDTGLAVEVDVTGRRDAVPASVGLAVYRIVQEALTNTLRHGEAQQAAVDVAVADGSVDLTVRDDGTGDPAAIRPGRGIAGMRERAALHHGSVTLQDADRGGIEVRARLVWEQGR
jgi:signal transduction histidine kinase